MKSDIPDKVVETLKEIGMTHQQAGWNCHGTYVLLHKALEKVAVHKGIVFNEPTILETNSEKKIVSLLVTGKMGDKLEWSIGEAAPSNNKNSYPYAMAEKRAKDRVILKLVGLHGDVYAEDEADAFKEVMPSDITGGTMDNGSNDIKGSNIKVNNGVPEPYPTPVKEEVKMQEEKDVEELTKTQVAKSKAQAQSKEPIGYKEVELPNGDIEMVPLFEDDWEDE